MTIELLPFVPPEVHGFYEIYPRGPQFKKVVLQGDVHKLLLQCRWPLFFVVFFSKILGAGSDKILRSTLQFSFSSLDSCHRRSVNLGFSEINLPHVVLEASCLSFTVVVASFIVNFSLTTLGSNPRKPSNQSC